MFAQQLHSIRLRLRRREKTGVRIDQGLLPRSLAPNIRRPHLRVAEHDEDSTLKDQQGKHENQPSPRVLPVFIFRREKRVQHRPQLARDARATARLSCASDRRFHRALVFEITFDY